MRRSLVQVQSLKQRILSSRAELVLVNTTSVTSGSSPDRIPLGYTKFPIKLDNKLKENSKFIKNEENESLRGITPNSNDRVCPVEL